MLMPPSQLGISARFVIVVGLEPMQVQQSHGAEEKPWMLKD